MDITGLTGHSGSGKTTFARMLSEHGFRHIDCDRIVHEKVYTDAVVLDRITKELGSCFVVNGVLDRRALADCVFSDDNAYAKLMSFIGEYIIPAVTKEIESEPDAYILLDAPTLFEFGMEKICARTVGIVSDNAVERICERDGIMPDAAKKRLSHQSNADFLKKHCDFVVENNGDISSLEATANILAKLIIKAERV